MSEFQIWELIMNVIYDIASIFINIFRGRNNPDPRQRKREKKCECQQHKHKKKGERRPNKGK